MQERGLNVLASSEGFWNRCLCSTSSSLQAWKTLAAFCVLASFLIFQNSSTVRSLSCLRGWMTLGINNGIIIMEADNQHDFEFNMQPYQEQHTHDQQVVDWRTEQRAYHLTKSLKIVTKYYYRTFMGRFKSAVYQMLIQNMTRQTQAMQRSSEIDWPYRSLLLKPNKNQHQLLQIEFINMCAEKIQSVFKGYLTRKRYKVAFGRAKKFMNLLNALVKGWKVRSIIRCIKVKQEIKSIQIKKTQVDKQEHNQTNKFNVRRFQYLKNSLRTEILHFQTHFNELYYTGAWIYEPRLQIPRIKVKKWSDKKQIVPMKQNHFNQTELQTSEFVPEASQQQVPQKKKRVREMRNNVRKAKNQQGNGNQAIQEQLKNESTISQMTTNTNSISDQRPIQAKGSYNTSIISEDRPIQAKGAYNFNQENATMPPISQQPKTQQNNTEDEARKIQLQKLQKKKLQKRQKYDPRKAIEQEKKRKKQQEPKQKEQVKSSTEIPPKPKPQQHKSKQENNKSQKTIKTQKEQGNRSTVNFPKSKAKVEAKIDCWGNRKTVTKRNSQNSQQFIKGNKIISNISEVVQPSIQKNIDLIPSQKLAAKIHQRRGKQKQKLQYSQQREKARIEIEKNCQQSQRIKQYLQLNKQHQSRETQASKYLKSQLLRQKVMQQQQQGEQQKDKRKDTVYRSVAELTQTYRTQYIARYQNLHPKLNLLAAARNTEQSNRIPVLSLQSEFVQRMIEQNKLNQRFWYTVSKMERTFKDFVKN